MDNSDDIKYVDVSQLASDFTLGKLPGILARMAVAGFGAALLVLLVLLLIQGAVR